MNRRDFVKAFVGVLGGAAALPVAARAWEEEGPEVELVIEEPDAPEHRPVTLGPEFNLGVSTSTWYWDVYDEHAR